MLKAATLYRPWADAMALGAKRNETRGYPCAHRGELAIHAAKWRPRNDDDLESVLDAQRAISRFTEGIACLDDEAYGAILCVVDLYDCVPTMALLSPGRILLDRRPDFELSETERALGNYSPGRYALLTRNLRLLRRPVPCRGQQGVPWIVPPEVEAEVRAQLEEK